MRNCGFYLCLCLMWGVLAGIAIGHSQEPKKDPYVRLSQIRQECLIND